MEKKAKLFKSRDPMLSTGVRNYGLIQFFNGRFATSDPKLIKKIEEEVIGDPALGVYVDPAEPEVDLSEAMSTVGIPQAELQKYIYDMHMAQQLGESSSTQTGLMPSHSKSSPLTGGPSGTQGFTAAQLASAVQNQGQSEAKVIAPASQPAAAVAKKI